MSIETDLNRIATALEEMVKLCHINAQSKVTIAEVQETGNTKIAKQIKAAKESKPVPPEPEIDPFAQDSAPAVSPLVTFEELTTLLKDHSVKLGTKVTIALIKKHGADAIAPKLNTIPEANYQACYDEAKADLVKLGVKK